MKVRRASPGVPLHFVHEVVLNHTSDECLPWPFGKSQDGYAKIKIDGKMVYAHRYICELVNGPPPSSHHQSAHSCGKGHEACVAIGHLSWKTPAENCADKLIHGTHSRGERQHLSKLAEHQVLEIRRLEGKHSRKLIGQMFGVSGSAVADIHTGRNWAWLSIETKETAL